MGSVDGLPYPWLRNKHTTPIRAIKIFPELLLESSGQILSFCLEAASCEVLQEATLLPHGKILPKDKDNTQNDEERDGEGQF